MRNKPLPAQSFLLSIFRYDPADGSLWWKIKPSRRISLGSEAACNKLRVKVSGRLFKKSRVIWKMIHDEEPPIVDHRDLNEKNNRIENLRAATNSQNEMNKKTMKTNKLQIRGVCLVKGRYRTTICVDRKITFLGNFTTIEEAKTAYAAASIAHHGEFGRT